jgi:acetyl esterase/lipase
MSKEQLAILNDLIRRRPHFSAGIESRRAGWDRMTSGFLPAADIRFEPINAHGVPGLKVIPPNVRGGTILYIHGGGFVLGSSQSYREFTGRLARAAEAVCIVPDYRLAPEHPFPAGFEDVMTAYRWMLAQGHDPAQTAIAGDSAGATLGLAALHVAKAAGEPLPACFVGICGWYDLTNSSPSILANGTRDIFVPPNFNDAAAKLYLGDADPRDLRASPLLGDLHGFPPALIHIGDTERLIDDSTRLHEKLLAAGVSSEIEIWPDMPHIWHFFGPMLEEGVEATNKVAAFIARHTPVAA